ncbi:MAG: GyrI-like domain-containing protein [Bacteroidetes bacterium]|nr:GyrI-like domain-containing protein [Bacteroidota bacterium]
MPKDYKKDYKDLYLPKTKSTIIDVPEMQFVAIEGKGNPNDENGEYQNAIPILYGIQYAIKMSKNGNNIPDGYFDYVVPPLEGFWWLDSNEDFSSKSKYNWLSLIRLPEFVNKKVFDWACEEASKKKNIDTQKAKYITIKEGLCVQCMHIGSYDEEPKTLKIMDDFVAANNMTNDVNKTRKHHEIYLSDPRKTEITKLKTILRTPIKRK